MSVRSSVDADSFGADDAGCGQQLRSDDPASLKDIVNLVQEKTAGREKTMTWGSGATHWVLTDPNLTEREPAS